MTTRQYYSNWWYGVVIPLFGALGWMIVIPFLENTTYLELPFSRIIFLASGLIIAVTSFLSPVFVGCLWLDARKLRNSDAPWSPNPWLWGTVGGVAMLVGVLLSYLGPKTVVALGYLYRRHSRVGLFGDRAVTETE